MRELKYIIFSEDDLIDYMDVVLPHVWDELLTLDSFSEEGVITLAAEYEGNTLGAAVARMTEGGEVQIHSLYVRPEYRRQKVGTALLDGVLEFARRVMQDPEWYETPVVQVVDYTLPEPELENFASFLKSVGFTFFDELPSLYLLSGEKAKALAGHPEGVQLVSELPEEDREMADALLDTYGIPTEPNLCALAGTADAPQALAFLIPREDGEYALTSFGPEAGEDTCRALLARCFAAAAERGEVLSIAADGTRNMHPALWEQLGAQAVRRFIARRHVIIEN